ncbi:hypothetical protein PLICRDRAFT_175611 [Plicaturopsis crispa FD-325 SS-3]|nr:hypothetical protein PLICRDRAFT_175611 [Plicaturopsis crispa FD-325 SS-3]
MPETLNSTLGAAFIGVVVASVLFGITNLQAYMYYHGYRRDWIVYKIFVGILWALDTAHLSLISHAVYHYLVTGFGDVIGLAVIVWSFKLQIAINVGIICIVQTLYLVRVWKLGSHRNKVIPAIVGLAVAGGYAIGVVLAYEVYQVHTFAELDRISWAVQASFAVSTGVDLAIASSMLYYLRSSRSGFAVTNSRIGTLINYTLSSGLATSTCSTAALVIYIIMPDNLIFMAIEFLLTKLYINSFLAMLNARKGISRKGEGSSVLSVSLPMQRPSMYATQAGNDALGPISPYDASNRVVVRDSYGADYSPQSELYTLAPMEGKPPYKWPPVR